MFGHNDDIAQYTSAKDHYKWCAKRAAETDDGKYTRNSAMSFLSDMKKHSGTKGQVDGFLGLAALRLTGPPLKKFIEGFDTW